MRQRPAALVGSVVCALLSVTPARAQEPAALPDELPPLDEIVAGETPPVRVFAEARLRAELEDAYGFDRGDEAGAGASLAGRAGAQAQLDFGRVVVAFVEGGRLGPPSVTPELVARPLLAPLHQAELALQTQLFGLPAELSLGRAPVIIADGRMLGDEPFDVRGRTLDGARARLHGDSVDVGAGAWWLGGVDEELDVVAAADATLHAGDQVDLDAWALAQRAGASGLLVPTLGSRVVGRLWMLEGRAAAEVQAPLAATTLERVGVSGRLSGGGRATLDAAQLEPSLPRAFLDLDGDLVAGDQVAGRVVHAPAPTRHGVRGALDLLAPDNTWCAALAVGLQEDRLTASLTGSMVGVVDRAGPLLDPLGAAVPARRGGGAGLALLELDLALQARLSTELTLGVVWGIAAPGPAMVGEVPAQRLAIELRAGTADLALP